MPFGLQLIEAIGIHPLPLQPFALLAGAFTALVLPWARRRTKRGSCRFCGYSLAGLEDIALCPECGRPRAVSHEWDTYGPVKYLLILIASLLPLLATVVLVSVQRSTDVDLLSVFDTRTGLWLICTLGSFGLMFVHALVLIGAGARWRLEMGWVVPLLTLAVLGNEIAIGIALLFPAFES